MAVARDDPPRHGGRADEDRRPGRQDGLRGGVTWRAVARILIVAGGCRGRALAASLVSDGHAVRVSTRAESGRAAIEETGAECWIGNPDRLASMRGVLDSVTVACWLLGSAAGEREVLEELHSDRLRFFLTGLIDTTVRGFVYESSGPAGDLLAGGEQIAREITSRNSIPAAFVDADPAEGAEWHRAARAAVDSFLAPA